MSAPYTIGTGRYYCGAPYSEIKTLLENGYKVLQECGFAGRDLDCGARIYAKVFRQYYEQSGECHCSKQLEDELIGRVLEELYKSKWQDPFAGNRRRPREESIVLYRQINSILPSELHQRG